jgi:hypothetical protein
MAPPILTKAEVDPPYDQSLKVSHESNNPIEEKTKRKRRKVEFDSNVQIQIRELFTSAELDNCWYSPMEYATFGKDAKKTVHRIRKGRSSSSSSSSSSSPSDLTGRGLEKYFYKNYYVEKKRRESNHCSTILGEQHRQRIEGKLNPKMLRLISSVNSKWALQNAIDLAEHDAQEAIKSHRGAEAERDDNTDHLSHPEDT